MARKKPKVNYYKIHDEEAAIRAEAMKKAYRREDGVLQLPTKTCEGFGFDRKLNLAT